MSTAATRKLIEWKLVHAGRDCIRTTTGTMHVCYKEEVGDLWYGSVTCDACWDVREKIPR